MTCGITDRSFKPVLQTYYELSHGNKKKKKKTNMAKDDLINLCELWSDFCKYSEGNKFLL